MIVERPAGDLLDEPDHPRDPGAHERWFGRIKVLITQDQIDGIPAGDLADPVNAIAAIFQQRPNGTPA